MAIFKFCCKNEDLAQSEVTKNFIQENFFEDVIFSIKNGRAIIRVLKTGEALMTSTVTNVDDILKCQELRLPIRIIKTLSSEIWLYAE